MTATMRLRTFLLTLAIVAAVGAAAFFVIHTQLVRPIQVAEQTTHDLNFVDAALLGVVEGFTEFLPISSTGHLILSSRLLDVLQSDFAKTFEIAIQTGAMLAVVLLYGKRVIADRDMQRKVAAAFVPTAIVGFLLYKVLKSVLLGNSAIVLAALFLGGIGMIAVELLRKESAAPALPQGADPPRSSISYRQAIALGLFQSLAIIPGISRSGATIVGGLLIGMNRLVLVEFSFLLAVPTIGAATAYDLMHTAGSFTAGELAALAVGFAVSFLTAVLSIRFLLSYVQRHSFIAFGVYRIIVAVLFWRFVG